MKESEVLRRHRQKRRRPRPMMPLEPVQPTREDLVRMLGGVSIDRVEPHERTDEATLDAIRALGLRIVWSCQLCAEPVSGRIPACPNVATVTMQETRARNLSSWGPTHVCQPHARGRKVVAGSSR